MADDGHKVTVDCRFCNDQSVWGRREQVGAGILILEMPPDYRLSEARLRMSLQADDSNPEAPIPTTTGIAPRRICCIATAQNVSQTRQLQPRVGPDGFS